MLLDATGEILKISDLGIAKNLANGMSSNKTIHRKQSSTFEYGTLGYQAPEINDGEKYTNSVDVFSLGRSLWQLLHKVEYVDIIMGFSSLSRGPYKHFYLNEPVVEKISDGELLDDANK